MIFICVSLSITQTHLCQPRLLHVRDHRGVVGHHVGDQPRGARDDVGVGRLGVILGGDVCVFVVGGYVSKYNLNYLRVSNKYIHYLI